MSLHTYKCRSALWSTLDAREVEAPGPWSAAVRFVEESTFSPPEQEYGIVVAVDDGERTDVYVVRTGLVAVRINRPAKGAVEVGRRSEEEPVTVPEADGCQAAQVQPTGNHWWVREDHPAVRGRGLRIEGDNARHAATEFAQLIRDYEVSADHIGVPRDLLEILVSGADDPPALTSGLWRKFTLSFLPDEQEWEVLVDHGTTAEVPS